MSVLVLAPASSRVHICRVCVCEHNLGTRRGGVLQWFAERAVKVLLIELIYVRVCVNRALFAHPSSNPASTPASIQVLDAAAAAVGLQAILAR